MKIKYVLNGISAAVLLSASVTAMADSGSYTDKPQSANASTAISDTAITAKVKAKYMNDSQLKGADIGVSTANGVVTLTGSAPSSDAKSAAGNLAKNVEGVKSVDNDINTPSAVGKMEDKMESKTKEVAKTTKRKVSDSWITTKVKSSLLADSVTKGFKIHVKTRHHVVALSGTVDTQAAVDQATDVAKQIDGVVSVDTSNLKVTSN